VGAFLKEISCSKTAVFLKITTDSLHDWCSNLGSWLWVGLHAFPPHDLKNDPVLFSNFCCLPHVRSRHDCTTPCIEEAYYPQNPGSYRINPKHFTSNINRKRKKSNPQMTMVKKLCSRKNLEIESGKLEKLSWCVLRDNTASSSSDKFRNLTFKPSNSSPWLETSCKNGTNLWICAPRTWSIRGLSNMAWLEKL